MGTWLCHVCCVTLNKSSPLWASVSLCEKWQECWLLFRAAGRVTCLDVGGHPALVPWRTSSRCGGAKNTWCWGRDWPTAARRMLDPSFTPCCYPVARFGYCSGSVWMGLPEGRRAEDASRKCCLVLPGPVLLMPGERRDLSPGHPGQKLGLGLGLGLGLSLRTGCFPPALWCTGRTQAISERERRGCASSARSHSLQGGFQDFLPQAGGSFLPFSPTDILSLPPLPHLP